MAQISITSFSMKLYLGCLILWPILNYGHKLLVPMVTVIQALYCTTKLTKRFTDSITSRNTSFFLYLTPSDLQETALVTAIGGRGATSSLCPSWVIYLKQIITQRSHLEILTTLDNFSKYSIRPLPFEYLFYGNLTSQKFGSVRTKKNK